MDRHAEFNFILKFAEQEDFSCEECCHQLRSLWTAYCLHHDLDPDTAKYDTDIAEVWKVISKNGTSPWDDIEENAYGFDFFDLTLGVYLS